MDGNSIFLFDLRPSKCSDGEHFLVKSGTFQITYKFTKSPGKRLRTGSAFRPKSKFSKLW